MQELFYPDVRVDIGGYTFWRGLSLKICSSKDKPYDWGILRFTEEYQPKIILDEAAGVTVKMGYDGVLQDVFYGSLNKGYNGFERSDEVFFKDRMLLLERTLITDTYIACTPQDIIEDGLRRTGVTQYQISPTIYPQKAMVSIRQKNMVDVLRQVNSLWGISVQGAFIRGVFYWGIKPEQTQVYEFEYANNIITLDREGGRWELTTVAMPFLQHSQMITVIHPKITGEFEIGKITSVTDDRGFTRSIISFGG